MRAPGREPGLGQELGRGEGIAIATGSDSGTWFDEVAEFLGPAYLRYSFTKGTEQEVDFLVEHLQLTPDHRVLDVGCGPGRHAHALARRNIRTHGVDLSQRFIDLATENAPGNGLATFSREDARHLSFSDEFDAVISLCQGGFGLVGDDDGLVLANMARAARRATGRVAFSAFSAYFLVKGLEDHDSFDAATGVNTERTTIRNEQGETREATLHTSCFTPRELRLLCRQADLEPRHLYSVTPGAYAAAAPSTDSPEFLVIASPAAGAASPSPAVPL